VSISKVRIGVTLIVALLGGQAGHIAYSGATSKPAAEILPAQTITTTDYILHIPAGAPQVRPVVFLLPMTGWRAAAYNTNVGFIKFLDDNNLTGVTLESQDGRWNAGTCCLKTGVAHRDDVAFIRSIYTQIAARTPIDPLRSYVIGSSAGGMMAWRMACQAPDIFAAAGVVSGSLMVSCGTTAAKIVRLHGLKDATVLYNSTKPGFEGHVFPTVVQVQAKCTKCSIEIHIYGDLGHTWPANAWTYLVHVTTHVKGATMTGEPNG
jgi:poly(3-hydroxybutyrate) depolymerase